MYSLISFENSDTVKVTTERKMSCCGYGREGKYYLINVGTKISVTRVKDVLIPLSLTGDIYFHFSWVSEGKKFTNIPMIWTSGLSTYNFKIADASGHPATKIFL